MALWLGKPKGGVGGGRPVYWDTDYSIAFNLYLVLQRIWAFFGPINLLGMGCICGWQAPDQWHWPSWGVSQRAWDEHVQECLLTRDEEGRVINL